MHLVILGNGAAGATAARFARVADSSARITVVSDEAALPFSRPALMYLYTGQLTRDAIRLYPPEFWSRNRIDLVRDRATGVDTAGRRLRLAAGGDLEYDTLLIATGAVTAAPAWAGAGLAGVQGFVRMADLDTMERDAPRRGVVVGGGLIGVELAEMLRVRGAEVTLLVREESYCAHFLPTPEARIVEAEIRRHGVDLRTSVDVTALEGDAGGRVAAVHSTDGTFATAWVGVATGVAPDLGLAAGAGLETARGVLVDSRLRASAPAVFAAGDCVELRDPPVGRPAVSALWYVAREQGAVAGRNMAGADSEYAPAVFYNSAKFFDLEWQVYGRVDATPPAGEASLYWADPRGRRALRVQHAGAGAVLGVSAVGIRLRADACSHWISAGVHVDQALAELRMAVFDEEFGDAMRVGGQLSAVGSQ